MLQLEQSRGCSLFVARSKRKLCLFAIAYLTDKTSSLHGKTHDISEWGTRPHFWRRIGRRSRRTFQPCSATESEEQDSVVDNNGPPSPRQRRLATAEGQEVAEIVVQTLQRMCTDECFHGFWQRVAKQAEDLHLPEAQLPQRRKVPRRFGVGDAEPEHPATPYDYFKWISYEALDLIINCIKSKFNQPGYKVYCQLQQLVFNQLREKTTKMNCSLLDHFMALISLTSWSVNYKLLLICVMRSRVSWGTSSHI